MSNLYNLEPQPTAKVVLRTTSGDLSLELFAKQTPLASRNFLQHCLDGYYDNTIFHRLVPGFIVQGGDPTGTGSGGISAINNGEPFVDEFHSRLKFNRRGLLGSANEGRDSNGSQFFLTLGVTPELQGKHTMFGRIEGDTIYNLMKIGDAELVDAENSDRPLYPTKITSTEILVNPFEDMVARVRTAPRLAESDSKRDVKKRKKPAGKNVLSFGGDELEESEDTLVMKRTKVNPKTVAAGATAPSAIRAIDTKSRDTTAERITKTSSNDTAPTIDVRSTIKPSRTPEDRTTPPASDQEDEDGDFGTASKAKRQRELERTKQEIAMLKASMKRHVEIDSKESSKPKSAMERFIPSNSTRGRRRGRADNEQGALDIFKAFKARLEDLPVEVTADTGSDVPKGNPKPEKTGDEEETLCDLHFIANCQSCRSWEENDTHGEGDRDGQDDDGAWMSHRLTFAKDTLGKDLEWKKKMEEIEVIDPREKAKAIKEDRKKSRNGGWKR